MENNKDVVKGTRMDIPFKKCTLFGILVHPYPV